MTSCFGSWPLVSPSAAMPSSTSLPRQQTQGQQCSSLPAGADQLRNSVSSIFGWELPSSRPQLQVTRTNGQHYGDQVQLAVPRMSASRS